MFWERGAPSASLSVSRRPQRTGRITELSDAEPFNGRQEKEHVWSGKMHSQGQAGQGRCGNSHIKGGFRKEHKNGQ